MRRWAMTVKVAKPEIQSGCWSVPARADLVRQLHQRGLTVNPRGRTEIYYDPRDVYTFGCYWVRATISVEVL